MKNFRLLLLSVLGAAAITTSCTDSSTNNTWHPSQSMISVVTDWGTSEYAWWDNYTIKYKGEGISGEEPGKGLVHDLPLQNPGNYDIDVFNSGEGFTYDYATKELSVEETEEGSGILFASPNELGIMFTGSASVTAVKDENVQVPIKMIPHVRRLNIRIYLKNDDRIPTDDKPSGARRPIKSITATMTGVAKSYNVATGTFGSTPYNVNLPFVVLTNTELDERYLNCNLNLLGIVGNDQTVTLEVEFESGPNLRTTPKNFHTELIAADFNNLPSFELIGSADTDLAASGEVTIEEYEDGGEEDIDVNEAAYTYSLFDRYPNANITADAQGIVIWTTPDGKHGYVLSGKESDATTWADTAKIDDTSFTEGIKNTLALAIHHSAYPSADMGAIEWLQTTYTEKDINGESKWFIPSKAEFNMIMDVINNNAGRLDAALAAYNFDSFLPNYWTSQTKPYVPAGKNPVANPAQPAKIYVWDGTDVYLETDAIDRTVPSTPVPVKYKTRALRSF